MATDTDTVTLALAAILPGGDRLAKVRPLATGFSNETCRPEGLDLILRLPPSAGAALDGHDVLEQARIYRAPGALPVPATTHIAEDAAAPRVPFE